MNYDESIYKRKRTGGRGKSGLFSPFYYQPITALTQQTDYGPVLII